MKESDLIYLATVMLLSTRGGAINNQDIAKARNVATKIHADFFGMRLREQSADNHALANT